MTPIRPSSSDRMVIAVDRSERRLAVGPLADPVEVPWSDICGVEIERNGEALTITNRGSQIMGGAVGALLLGPMGLLLGGLTGSKRNEQRVNDLSLKVLIDDQHSPVHRVQFFTQSGKGAKPDSAILQEPAKQIEKFHALLTNAIRTTDNERLEGREGPQIEARSAEERIGDLWKLKQSGALSDEEFASAKGRVLAADQSTLLPPQQ